MPSVEWKLLILICKRLFDILSINTGKAIPHSCSWADLTLHHRQTSTATLCHGSRDMRFKVKQRRNFCWKYSTTFHTQLSKMSLRGFGDSCTQAYIEPSLRQLSWFFRRHRRGFISTATTTNWGKGNSDLKHIFPQKRYQGPRSDHLYISPFLTMWKGFNGFFFFLLCFVNWS